SVAARIRKESRALAPIWLAAAAASTAAVLSPSQVRGLAFPAYLIGVAALGAWSVGHEYSHRTLNTLLAQPVARARVWLTKLGVLAVALVAIGGLGYLMLLPRERMGSEVLVAMAAIPLLWSFFVAPWLTMISGSAIGGAVFTIALPATLMILGDRLGIARYGYTGDVDTVQLSLMWWGTFVCCAIGAALGWRRFIWLEAVEGGDAELHLPAWPASRASVRTSLVRHNPYWLLVKKEVRLQQITFAVTALWTIFGAVVAF